MDAVGKISKEKKVDSSLQLSPLLLGPIVAVGTRHLLERFSLVYLFNRRMLLVILVFSDYSGSPLVRFNIS